MLTNSIVVLLGVLLLVLVIPQLLAKTDTPEFCGSCHIMDNQFDAWQHSGAHRQVRCVDCHLPHQHVVQYYVWKSIDGGKDLLMFHTGTYTEPLKASAHARRVLQANCIRCHQQMVARIDHQRRCWDCHRRIRHQKPGIFKERKP